MKNQLTRGQLEELYAIAVAALGDIIDATEELFVDDRVRLDHVRKCAYGARAELQYELIMAEQDNRMKVGDCVISL